MLRTLYLKGPSYLGFWAGADSEDICADLTGVSSRTWRLNPAGCFEVIERRYQSFRVMVTFAIFCVVCWQAMVTTILTMQVVAVHLLAQNRFKPPTKAIKGE